MDGLNFVNGLELSPAEDYLLVCETGRARIHKYYLNGNNNSTHTAVIIIFDVLGFESRRPSTQNWYQTNFLNRVLSVLVLVNAHFLILLKITK